MESVFLALIALLLIVYMSVVVYVCWFFYKLLPTLANEKEKLATVAALLFLLCALLDSC